MVPDTKLLFPETKRESRRQQGNVRKTTDPADEPSPKNAGPASGVRGCNETVLFGRNGEPVTRNDVDKQKPTYYMLHQAVLRESSGTARLRVVFDASSHGNKSKSLNQNLESGPNLIADLVGLLLNFRSHRIALVERRMIQILQATSSTAILSVLNIERYSDAARLFWVTAWILGYVGKLRHVSSNTGQLTAIELDRAEKY